VTAGAGITLGQLLVRRARAPRADGFRFLDVDDGTPGTVRGAQLVLACDGLLDLARRAAGTLAARGVGTGDRVVLCLPNGPVFLAAFHACALLGAAAVPIPPPGGTGARTWSRVRRVVRACAPAAVVALGSPPDAPPVAVLGPADLLGAATRYTGEPAADPDLPAVIQYTSGSTRSPRGAVLSHRAVVANLRALQQSGGARREDVIVDWVPLFHDFGLVDHALAALVWDTRLVLMPTASFVRRPAAWLQAISASRGTISGAPNFAFALCVRHVSPEQARALDLSSWQHAVLGGEPVSARTIADFRARFEPCGLPTDALRAGYGLTEMCSATTFSHPRPDLAVDRVDRRVLEAEGRAEPTGEAGPPDVVRTIVEAGEVLPGHEVRIVDEARRPLPDRRVGRIELRGPSLMDGYLGDPDATARVLEDGWLRTGDRGYLVDGTLYVTGRADECILATGRLLDPTDLEAAAATVPGVRTGHCAAVGPYDTARGTEEVVLVCESAAVETAERDRIVREVRAAVLAEIGLPADRVLVVPPGSLPFTSSGKLQRMRVRMQVEAGEIAS